MSSFDSSVGRRPARSIGAMDTLTHAPRPSPDMARALAAHRAQRPYTTTSAALKLAQARGRARMAGRSPSH